MGSLTKAQKKSLRRRQEQQRQQREKQNQAQGERLSQHDEEKRKRQSKILMIVALAVLVSLAGGGFVVYATQFAPSPLDNFARCLTDKGVVMYGAIDWCHYTKEQVGMFGSAFKYLDYRDYSEDKSITVTPTWEINGERYERVQSLERLSGLTGCSLSDA